MDRNSRKKFLLISTFCVANLLNIPLYCESAAPHSESFITDLLQDYSHQPVLEPIASLNGDSSKDESLDREELKSDEAQVKLQ